MEVSKEQIPESEKLENISLKMDMGLMSQNEAIQELRGVDKEAATDLIKEIEEMDFANNKERINEDSRPPERSKEPKGSEA